MDSRGFVMMAKQYAVDEVVRDCVKELKSPRLPKRSPAPRGQVEKSIRQWVNDRSRIERRRSDWFSRLAQSDQRLIGDILEECAERALANFFCLVDGVGGNYEGVFEIVAVEEERRTVLNPQNTDMLHDIFSEVSEEGRRKIIMPKKYALCSEQELLQMLEARAKIHGQELDEGRPKKANAQFDIMVKLSCELLRRGRSAQLKILSLLNNDNPHVKMWAAFLALEFDSSQGERVLEEIGRNYRRNLNLGFSAEFTLKQWRKGELRTLSEWGCKGEPT